MSLPDPRMPTDRVPQPYAACETLAARAWAEVVDHTWPWKRGIGAPHKMLRAAGSGLAIAATLAWVLAALGELRAGALIGWWLGWSVYEVLVRLRAKRYVKDGPWWRSDYRAATVMDMICYVGFKNLLIGASLFLALKAFGWLVV